MILRKYIVVLALLAAKAASSRADIYRWDNGDVIPGTQGIAPGAAMQLDHHNLAYAELSGFDLTGSNFEASNLTNAHLFRTTMTNANLSRADLTYANLASATLANADLTSANLSNTNLDTSILMDAKFTGAIVEGANFGSTSTNGFTKEQLYSTRSYQDKNLSGIQLGNNILNGWNFSQQNLANALMRPAVARDANLAGANLSNADMSLSLESVIFSADTVYNQGTVFFSNFDPVAKGLKLVLSAAGDFDANGILDVADIHMFQSRILGTLRQRWLPVSMFDLDGNFSVTTKDLTVWVKDIKNTYFGDANLDGTFESADILQVFAAGKFEATEHNENGEIINASNWSTGDWNTDGEFTTSDLVLAFQDGGYEAGPRAVVAVPEPSGLVLLTLGLCGFLWRRRVRKCVWRSIEAATGSAREPSRETRECVVSQSGQRRSPVTRPTT